MGIVQIQGGNVGCGGGGSVGQTSLLVGQQESQWLPTCHQTRLPCSKYTENAYFFGQSFAPIPLGKLIQRSQTRVGGQLLKRV